MTETIVILRVNEGSAWAYFQVFARDAYTAGVCAKLHLMFKYGVETY